VSTAAARVLIVDDDPLICQLLLDCLSNTGQRCTAVMDPLLARNLLRENPFRVMLADVQLPNGSGLDLLRFAGESVPQCRVILMTGHGRTQYLTEAMRLGAYDYLEKPFQVREVVETVQAAADESSDRMNLMLRAARAIESERNLRRSAIESIRALVRAVEAKDPYTRRHSEQVAHYAVHLARYLKLPNGQVESIRTASLMHDIGKIGVPDSVLTKPGPLTDDEFRLIRQHPVLGAEILQNISVFSDEARLVRHHHESYDGRGYPDGLAAEEIPLGARVINVADSMDAMLMNRTYKMAYSLDATLDELRRCAAKQFDPRIAAGAVQWCREHPDLVITPENENAVLCA